MKGCKRQQQPGPAIVQNCAGHHHPHEILLLPCAYIYDGEYLIRLTRSCDGQISRLAGAARSMFESKRRLHVIPEHARQIASFHLSESIALRSKFCSSRWLHSVCNSLLAVPAVCPTVRVLACKRLVCAIRARHGHNAQSDGFVFFCLFAFRVV